LIDQVNPAFDEAFGCTSDEICNQPLATLAISEQVATLERTLETVVQTRQPQRVEVTVQYQTSAAFDSEMMLSPVQGPDHQLLGVICSLRDITERKKQEVRLRQMLEHEIELGELKSHYISMAAHDLRNPLAAIRITLDAIHKYHYRLTEEQRQAKYDSIQRSINVMVELLNDILTIGQAESGNLEFKPGLLDLVAFSRDLVAELQQTTGASERIKFSYQGLCHVVHMDAGLLRHILSNLLSNALKYSSADKPVRLDVQCESSGVTFHVQDRGIGIPQADQKRLFGVFQRAENVGDIPGTGLGLAIVKQSVDLHGGTVTFESEEGIGTVFTVRIPQPSPIPGTSAQI
jgi:PAS domain S-box-containing protein